MVRQPMTKEGYDALSSEFHHLNNVLKPQVNLEKQRAAELGDRSENAEYHAAKEKLRHIDRRLKYLASLLDVAQIINPDTLDHSKVCFGSSVEIEDLHSGVTQTITISGILESEPEHAIISYQAPLARALMGKTQGDEIEITLPQGTKQYEIIKIFYRPIMEHKKLPFRQFDIR